MSNYSGKDNLEVMEEARVYNKYLLDMLQAALCDEYKNIMDFGAGTGSFAQKVQEMYPSKMVIALEPAENLDAYYRTKSIKKISTLSECKKVDLIYSFNVLEHIENDEEVLNNLYDILPSGGKLCLYVPAFPCLYSAMDKKVGHYRRYEKKELIQKVQRAGFKIKSCQYRDFVGFFASLVYKYAERKDGELNQQVLKFYDKVVMPVSILLDKVTRGYFLGKNLWLEAEKKYK